jgi:hypothetical protein
MNDIYYVLLVIGLAPLGMIIALCLCSPKSAEQQELDDEEQITQITAWRIENLNKAAKNQKL